MCSVVITISSYVEILLPATTTTTTTSSEQQQRRITFQTWSSTSFDDDGHYSDINSSVIASGEAARIPSHYNHYNYIEMDQLSAVDEGAVEQRQTSSDNYQGLDPSLLETLRQPPAPSVYASLSPNVTVMNQDANNTEPDGANPHNIGGLDLASFMPRADAGISSTSQTTGSAPHNYLELIADPQDDNVDDSAVQSRPDDYQGLDPSVLETLRQPPTPSVYASLSPNVPVMMSQDVNSTEAGAANPHNTEGFDLTSLLPHENAVIRSTSQITGSAAYDDGAVQSRLGDYQGLDPSILETLRQPPTPSVYASLSGNRADVSQEVDNTGPDAANNEALNAARLNELSLPHEHVDMSSTS